MPMTDLQIADAAIQIVLDTLPYPREFMEQLTHTSLPFMLDSGKICGPAPDNAAVFTEYPSDWTGLAVSTRAGQLRYWFIFNCEYTNTRAHACLGSQPSVCAAIVSAALHVQSNIRVWGGQQQAA